MFNDDLYTRRNDAIFLMEEFGKWGRAYMDFITKGTLVAPEFLSLMETHITRNFVNRMHALLTTHEAVKTGLTRIDRDNAARVFSFPDISIQGMSIFEIRALIKKSQDEIEQFITPFYR